MKIWIVMCGETRDSVTSLSVHRNMTNAFGAALRHMMEHLGEWYVDLTDSKTSKPSWFSGDKVCWVEEREVV